MNRTALIAIAASVMVLGAAWLALRSLGPVETTTKGIAPEAPGKAAPPVSRPVNTPATPTVAPPLTAARVVPEGAPEVPGEAALDAGSAIDVEPLISTARALLDTPGGTPDHWRKAERLFRRCAARVGPEEPRCAAGLAEARQRLGVPTP